MVTQFPGPRVPCEFIKDCLAGFHRRRKAIKYHLGTFETAFHTEKDQTDPDIEWELLQVEARTRGRHPIQITLRIWEDGETWFRLCRAAPIKQGGWTFHESFRGSVVSLDPKEVVRHFEESLLEARSSQNGADLRGRIQKAWDGSLN